MNKVVVVTLHSFYSSEVYGVYASEDLARDAIKHAVDNRQHSILDFKYDTHNVNE